MFKNVMKLVGWCAAYLGIYVGAVYGFTIVGGKVGEVLIEMQDK